jgi:hypothetical protein
MLVAVMPPPFFAGKHGRGVDGSVGVDEAHLVPLLAGGKRLTHTHWLAWRDDDVLSPAARELRDVMRKRAKEHHKLVARNVSHWDGSPVSKPRLNQRRR